MADDVTTARLLPTRVRNLTAEDLGLATPDESVPTGVLAPLPEDDPVVETARDLLEDFGGLIFVGPPGTSKSWTAARLAVTLAGDECRVRFTQFHPSYQYEDFVQGYIYTSDGFELVPKLLMNLCKTAGDHPDDRYVLVIDELSRGEPGRIFGEALTYVEKSKRGLKVHLAAGHTLTIPDNLLFLATMNPLDRGVDEVDAAFERRFAKYPMDPDEVVLTSFLIEAGMEDRLRERVVTFFKAVNQKSHTNPFAALGHTYFAGVGDEGGLQRVWQHQLRFHFEKAFRGDPAGLADIAKRWDAIFEMQAPEDVAGADSVSEDDSSDNQ